MIKLRFSVTGYGGLHLPFSGITHYLRGLVSAYEHTIIAGVRILIVSSSMLPLYGCSILFPLLINQSAKTFMLLNLLEGGTLMVPHRQSTVTDSIASA